ncbi:MAG: Phosphatidylglycerophosphatase A [Gammaproteobacteria bacterium]|nr:Phosphatidylglycerophosphatase A [Gammaproteobacteria bacterium]
MKRREASRPPRGLLADPGHFIALGFGAGCAPRAPGTFGTLIGVVLYLPLHGLSLTGYLAATAVVIVVGIAVCGRAARRLGLHDHPSIVWDEVAGYLVTMCGAPAGWGWVLAGFLLFRLLDIAKPWPIRWFDRRLSGGLGIMADDLVAGLLAMTVLQVFAKVISL